MPERAGGGGGRLQRCIRDLSALSALPALCVGRTPAEALAMVVDALPTALGCRLVYLRLPGTPPIERGTLDGRSLTAGELAEVAAATGTDCDGTEAQLFLGGNKLYCLEAEIPAGSERGCFLAGSEAELDPETDRVLVRTAANVAGSILASAHALEAARRKDDFLAILGHELRNPLAPIMTAVELLGRHAAAAREREIIDRNARHLVRIVDDLLDISRVTRGHVELRREQVVLGAVLERAAELATPLVVRHGHRLSIARADDVAVEGDPVRLAQVFGNLLTNAAKFTPPGGRIDVTVDRLPGRVRTTVRDDGRGLGPDQLQRIFEPFVQVDRERDALRGGLGLGLAIVSNLVQRHGGAVSVASDGPGRGAAFTVELPTIVGSAPIARAVTATGPRAARAGVRVLVVDDNVDLADMLAEALALQGFETSVANDGHGALATWRRVRPQVGILDVGLPDLDGYALAKELRAEYGTDATLIAATGYGQPTDRLRAADAGFDRHFVKPVRVQELVAYLDKLLAARAGGDGDHVDGGLE